MEYRVVPYLHPLNTVSSPQLPCFTDPLIQIHHLDAGSDDAGTHYVKQHDSTSYNFRSGQDSNTLLAHATGTACPDPPVKQGTWGLVP